MTEIKQLNLLARWNKLEKHIKISDEFKGYLLENKFFIQPASTKYHGAYEGGLFDHSLEVANQLIKLTENNNLKWQRKESPIIIGLFHDLCKIDNYVYDEPLCEYNYNKETLLKGHGEKSVMLLSQHIQLTEEEVMCIRYHMGAYNTDEWDLFDRAIRKYPNVLWTHTADMIASKISGV